MRTYTAREAKNRFGEMLQASQRDAVIVTRNGRPYARVTGVDALSAGVTPETLAAQERSLLSYFAVAGSVTPGQSPEARVRSLRDEW